MWVHTPSSIKRKGVGVPRGTQRGWGFFLLTRVHFFVDLGHRFYDRCQRQAHFLFGAAEVVANLQGGGNRCGAARGSWGGAQARASGNAAWRKGRGGGRLSATAVETCANHTHVHTTKRSGGALVLPNTNGQRKVGGQGARGEGYFLLQRIVQMQLRPRPDAHWSLRSDHHACATNVHACTRAYTRVWARCGGEGQRHRNAESANTPAKRWAARAVSQALVADCHASPCHPPPPPLPAPPLPPPLWPSSATTCPPTSSRDLPLGT